MAEISYRRHRFPLVIIQHAVWLYLRFTLSYRDVEELLAERGLDISYETVRCWVLKFGPVIARRLRRCRPRPSNRWHLDEMVVRIAGERIAPKTLIRQCDGESAKCSGSSQLAPPSGFSACTPPCTTPSISNAISSRARRSGSSEPRQRTSGRMRSRSRDRESGPGLAPLVTS